MTTTTHPRSRPTARGASWRSISSRACAPGSITANRRLTIGVSVGVTECLGPGAPDVQLLDASLTLAYTWYPLW